MDFGSILIQCKYKKFPIEAFQRYKILKDYWNEFWYIMIPLSYNCKVEAFGLIYQIPFWYIMMQFRYNEQNFNTSWYMKMHCNIGWYQSDTTLETCQRFKRFKHLFKYILTPLWRYPKFLYELLLGNLGFLFPRCWITKVHVILS